MQKFLLLSLASSLAVAPAFAQDALKPDAAIVPSVENNSDWSVWNPMQDRSGAYTVRINKLEATQVLRDVAAKAGLQILIDDSIPQQTTATLSISGPTSKAVLDAVAKQAGLITGCSGNTVFVLPPGNAELMLAAQDRIAEMKEHSPVLTPQIGEKSEETIWTPVDDKPGYFNVVIHGSELTQVLNQVAAQAGAHLLLDDSIKTQPVELSLQINGATPDYVFRRVAEVNGLVTGRCGDTIFVVPAANARMLLAHQKLIKDMATDLASWKAAHQPTPAKPGYSFNMNRDHQVAPNVPPDAKSFEFNGERVYHLPVKKNEMI